MRAPKLIRKQEKGKLASRARTSRQGRKENEAYIHIHCSLQLPYLY